MPSPLDAKEFLTRGECSTYLEQFGYKITRDRLAHLACSNPPKGPPCYRVGWTKVYYRRKDVETWVRQKTKRIA